MAFVSAPTNPLWAGDYEDVTASRAPLVWYRNTSLNPLFVVVRCASFGDAELIVNDTESATGAVQYTADTNTDTTNVYAIVPPLWYYQLTQDASGMAFWWEL